MNEDLPIAQPAWYHVVPTVKWDGVIGDSCRPNDVACWYGARKAYGEAVGLILANDPKKYSDLTYYLSWN